MSGYVGTYGTSDGEGDRLQRYSRTIGSNVQKIQQNVKTLEKFVAQLGTEQDNSQLQAQLHQLQQYTNGLAKDTTAELRAFKGLTAPSGEEGRGWRMQRDRLTKQFTQVLNDFQAVQRSAAARQKEAISRARSDSSVLVAIDAPPTTHQEGFMSPLQQKQESAEQQRELDQIREREDQMRQLESDIVDVNQIFRDLATMVHEQGEVIDSIEANIETAQTTVSQGNVQLSGARNYQSRARRKKLILFLILLAVVAFIIGLIAYSVKN